MKTCFFCIAGLLFIQTVWAADHQLIKIDKYAGQPQKLDRIRVASVAVLPDRWQKETNWRRIETLVQRAAVEGGAQLVVTPEGALDGYVINDVNAEKNERQKNALLQRFQDLAEGVDGPYIRRARSLSDTLDIFLLLGFLEKEDSLLFNTAVLIDADGDLIGRYRKSHFAQGYVVNPKSYRPGDEFPIFATPFGLVGILICYDRQLPEPARILALKGAQLLLVPSYGGYTDENGWNTALLRTRAYENSLPLVFCHPYQSLIISERGDLRAMGNAGQIVYAELTTALERYQKRFDNRRPALYKELYAPQDPAEPR
ncbi:MAG TPA: carbon-nitrogen hydrolase family protein [bacterium]|nr:carbon-nitrogen hydrolase family protein [bacterium]HPN34035.1 carbon-nitrogen hydrolase family protein [bacterium]